MIHSLPSKLLPVTAIDLETNRQGSIRHMGAFTDDNHNFEHKGGGEKEVLAALVRLNDFCRGSRFILGHNLIGHDFPVLRSIKPDLGLLNKPVIDTLFLSPLAFPRNPYHRLVKDYKLVRDSLNDPVADARLALSIFKEQYQAFQKQAQQEPELIRFYHYCFATARVVSNNSDCRGLAEVFQSLLEEPLNSDQQAFQALSKICRGLACPPQLERVALQHLPKAELRVMLPYCIAWLKVSGGNSVLPSWVRHRFPAIPDLLKRLREEHCGNEHCHYCADNHDPVKQLQRYFNYSDFRTTSDGRRLQRDIVTAGMNNEPLLGILPTAGGKSICFQIPALVRYYRRGLLTVIISPLQALMKDQVDNLKKKTGSMAVAAIYGLLTPPERGAILEQVRLGDIGLLYISPEQLRNRSVINVLSQREIGCWVFDEAHCLSNWGHDFRPDYLYCSRFIREQAKKNQLPLPPIACYTATAKTDVAEDICHHFQSTLGQQLTRFQGGVERSNLSYEVHLVTQATKSGRVAELIEERLPEDGSCIVYCATRKNTEELSGFLAHKGLSAVHFHGGLEAPAKKDILEHFVQGNVRIICATNAFGMGVDKDNVRLVVHADIPGSLENYLQEAGRAGRDERLAECILLFDEQDIETQFKLGALSQVHQRDIQQILRGIRRLEKEPEQDIVITTGELLRSESVDTSFDLDERSADTKVKTAIAWLERSDFLERNENVNQVFQGKPLFSTLDEATNRLDRLQLSPTKRQRWELILSELINADPDEGISADHLAEQIGHQLKDGNGQTPLSTIDIMAILNQMADVGLVSNGLLMTAFLRPKGRNNARDIHKKLCQLERAMLDMLRQAHPDDHEQTAYPLDLRALNQKLLDEGLDFSNPDLLRNLLKSLAEDGKGLAESRGSIEFRYAYKDHYYLKLCRTWTNIVAIMERRQVLSQHILNALYQAINPSEQSSQAEVLVEFSLGALRDSIRQDMTLAVHNDKELAAIERGLLFLHEQNAIILQQGLAVFRQAMTLKLNQPARGRRYNKGDYDPLARHYEARVAQVHVMNEYARLGLEKIRSALRLVRDYFEQDNLSFLSRYFRGKRKLLEQATSEQSLKDIVESLGNPQQQAIVQAPADRNMLVLAGPGSGKTRVVVHRCAYLTRVQRVQPFSILVLCYNHSAAVTLRKRLKHLLGREAREITVQTFHGLAVRLTGVSLSPDQKKDKGDRDFDFDKLIPKATALLRGHIQLPGIADDQVREKLLAGFQYILVDEYQDIDEQQYDMISAIAGRTLNDGEEKLSILAVGDDDQSIYGFRRANVKYIRQFEQDYKADRHYLVQNYRSTRHIINAANSLIVHNQDRMKTEQEISINNARKSQPAGGLLDKLDPVGRGKVQILSCQNISTQTLATVQELQRLKELWSDLQWTDCAILARHGISKPELTHIRSALEYAGVPVSLPLENGQNFSLFRVREFDALLRCLGQHREALADSQQLRDWVVQLNLASGPWKSKLLALVESWEEETGGAELPVSAFSTYLVDYLREARREQRFGEGVHVGTVHSSKGMEFRVVFLLDGGWQTRKQNDREEERRLLYVGMTRAMEQLIIYQRQDAHNPDIDRLDEGSRLERSVSPTGHYSLKEYRALGMGDLYLSYAGTFAPTDKIHTVLSQLNTGDTVILKPDQDRIKLFSRELPIAALSKAQTSDWQQLNGKAISGRVLAMVRRRVEDSDEAYQGRHKCEEWEVPVIELVWNN